MNKTLSCCVLSAQVMLGVIAASHAAPQPGEVYLELYEYPGTSDTGGWRVTDPAATAADAQLYLPNKWHTITIPTGALAGATRVEAMLERWMGHPGSREKRLKFNSDTMTNPWIDVPQLTAVSDSDSSMAMDNPVVTVPVTQLREGTNRIDFYCNGDGDWGSGNTERCSAST